MADVLAVALVAAGAVGCGVAVWYLTRPATAPTVDALLIGGPFAGEAIKVPLAGGMPPTGYVRQHGAPGGGSARAVYTLRGRREAPGHVLPDLPPRRRRPHPVRRDLRHPARPRATPRRPCRLPPCLEDLVTALGDLDLVGYLLARLDEAEALARRAAFGWGSDWSAASSEDDYARLAADGSANVASSEDIDVIRHAALWDPARVLTEITAQRAIIAMHRPWGGPLPDGTRDCQVCGWRLYGCLTLLALAQIHAARPDFPPAWRTP